MYKKGGKPVLKTQVLSDTAKIMHSLDMIELQFRQIRQLYGLMVDKEIEQAFHHQLTEVTKYSYELEQKLYTL